MTYSFTVYGLPAPQGSKRHVGHGVMVESSKKVAPWREAVKWAAIQNHGHPMIDGPVILTTYYYLPMPKSMSKKARATALPITRPDIDKLDRAVMDALTDAGMFKDDSRVVSKHSHKL